MSDAQSVLDHAFWIDGFMRRHRLATPAERQWNLIKSDLNTLASYFRISWNWRNPPQGNIGVNDRWTGTFRLNSSPSDNEENAVQKALRSLPYTMTGGFRWCVHQSRAYHRMRQANHKGLAISLTSKPNRIWRFFSRRPVHLYKLHLAWLLGHKFMLLVRLGNTHRDPGGA